MPGSGNWLTDRLASLIPNVLPTETAAGCVHSYWHSCTVPVCSHPLPGKPWTYWYCGNDCGVVGCAGAGCCS